MSYTQCNCRTTAHEAGCPNLCTCQPESAIGTGYCTIHEKRITLPPVSADMMDQAFFDCDEDIRLAALRLMRDGSDGTLHVLKDGRLVKLGGEHWDTPQDKIPLAPGCYHLIWKCK